MLVYNEGDVCLKVYNKLVRDFIPEIIENSGQSCKFELLSDDDYLESLNNKLLEELHEYFEQPCLEELADLTEVIYAIIGANNWTHSDLEKIRHEKLLTRGGFSKKVFLKCVEG